jgi:hypothetical protein
MDRRIEEWFKQSDYDIETAEFMLQGGSTFMRFSCVICP